MIIEALWAILRGTAEAVLDLMPNIEPPDISGAVDGMAALWGYFGWANKYVPLVEVAAMLTLLASVYVTMFLIKGLVWLLSKAHILGGGSN